MLKEIRLNENIIGNPAGEYNSIFENYQDSIERGLEKEKFNIGDFEIIYVMDRKKTTRDEALKELFPKEIDIVHNTKNESRMIKEKYNLGAIEAEVLNDFFVNWNEPEIRIYQELIGDVGVGKSAIIEFLFDYILDKKENFFKNGIYIKIDLKEKLDESFADINKGLSGLKNLLNTEIYTIIFNKVESKNENFAVEFWDYLSTLTTSNPFIEKISILSQLDQKLKKRKILEFMEKIHENEDQIFDLNTLRLKYINHIFNGKVCLIIDNSDTIPSTLHPQLRNLVYQIQKGSGVCLIMSLRYRSVGRAERAGARQLGDFHPYWTIISPPDFRKLIEKRCNFILDHMKKNGLKKIYFDTDSIKYIISRESACSAVKALLMSFTSDESLSYLMNISNNDIRRALLLINRLCQASSETLDFRRIIKSLWSKSNQRTSFWYGRVPLYEIRKLHLLNGNKIFNTSDDPRGDTIENIFCCKIKKGYGNNLIKYRILEVLYTYSEKIRQAELYDILRRSFTYSKTDFDKAIEQLFQRPKKLIWCLNASFITELKFTHDTIELSPSGKYYYENLCMTFEYITNIFFDSFINSKYRKELKPYQQYSQNEKWDIMLDFSKHIHSKVIEEFKSDTDSSLSTYFSKTGITINMQPEFRVIDSLSSHLNEFIKRDLIHLRIHPKKKELMLEKIYKIRADFIVDYEEMYDPQNFQYYYK